MLKKKKKMLSSLINQDEKEYVVYLAQFNCIKIKHLGTKKIVYTRILKCPMFYMIKISFLINNLLMWQIKVYKVRWKKTESTVEETTIAELSGRRPFLGSFSSHVSWSTWRHSRRHCRNCALRIWEENTFVSQKISMEG